MVRHSSKNTSLLITGKMCSLPWPPGHPLNFSMYVLHCMSLIIVLMQFKFSAFNSALMKSFSVVKIPS